MIIDLLQKKYSCRNFSEKLISKDIIHYILECGRLSASGGNDQPWKFGVIVDKNILINISKVASINYDQNWISKAPLIIVLCTELKECKDEINCINRFHSMKKQIMEMDDKLYSTINRVKKYNIY